MSSLEKSIGRISKPFNIKTYTQPVKKAWSMSKSQENGNNKKKAKQQTTCNKMTGIRHVTIKG